MSLGKPGLGQGDRVSDMDAGLEQDKVILILHSLASGEHVIDEALRTE